MHSLLEGLLGVFPQLSLDLLGPVAESVLQNGGLVLRGSLLVLGDVSRWQWEISLTLNQSQRDLSVGQELVELLHEVLGN